MILQNDHHSDHESRRPLVLAQPDYPSWGLAEVFAVAAFLIVSFYIAFFLLNSLTLTFGLALSAGTKSVIGEMLGYSLLFAVLWGIFTVQDRPMLEALGWVRHRFTTLSLVSSGVMLAIFIVMLTLILRTPTIETPLQKLLSDLPTRLLVGLFGVTAGPVVEELLFRGFLQPVLLRMMGVLPGLLVTAALFGLMHGQQYSWQWQLILGVSLVGFVLGVVRHVSGSTRASSIVHIAYNSVFFLAMLAGGEQSTSK